MYKAVPRKRQRKEKKKKKKKAILCHEILACVFIALNSHIDSNEVFDVCRTKKLCSLWPSGSLRIIMATAAMFRLCAAQFI